jgi:toxin ParE1/3/4
MGKVVILPIAAQDLADIVEYLAQFYESTALSQYDRIVKKIKELPRFPEKYEAYGTGQYRLAYRRMPVDNILYSMW